MQAAPMGSHSLHMPPTASTADGITGAVRRDEEGVEWIDHMATDYSYYGRHGGLDDE